MLTGLKPGEDLVDLAGAFDEAFGLAGSNAQDWRPGESKDKGGKAAPRRSQRRRRFPRPNRRRRTTPPRAERRSKGMVRGSTVRGSGRLRPGCKVSSESARFSL